jgi:hypothetical protein
MVAATENNTCAILNESVGPYLGIEPAHCINSHIYATHLSIGERKRLIISMRKVIFCPVLFWAPNDVKEPAFAGFFLCVP